MRRMSVKLVLLLAAAWLSWGQVPTSPTISSIVPVSVPAGSNDTTLTVNGANFVILPAQGGAQSCVYLNGVFTGISLATTFVNGSTLTATLPAGLLLSPTQYSVQVGNPDETVSNTVTISVLGPSLSSLSPTSIPAGSPAFTLTLTGANFVSGSYVSFRGNSFDATFVNSTTLTATVPSSLIAVAGQASVMVHNPGGSSTGALSFVVGPPGVSISPSSTMPSGGVVGVIYQGFVFAKGGTGSYKFSLGGGSLPDGVTLSSSGMVYGTPKTPGQFSFTVVATDSAGDYGSADFSVTIRPAPLNITGGPTGPVSVGAPINITFTATGGVGPYRFSLSGSLPQGTAFNNGVLSGTPTTAGAFTFQVAVTDSTGLVFSSDFTLTVTPALSLGGTLSDGKVGVPYAGQISATGGVGPYSYVGSGLPGGLSLSAAGGISGTPTAAGQFTLTVTVTDSKGTIASGKFAFTIAPADLTIVTASLPDGVVGVAYTAALSASGGVPPYAWTVTGLPDGLTATATGEISGTPKTAGKFTVKASVGDASGSATTAPPIVSKSFSLTIAPAPLIVTTATAPNGTVGTAYAASFAASGGTAPYTFSASGLPAGLSMSAAGAISGTPTTPGATTIVVTVKDSSGAGASHCAPTGRRSCL